MRARPQTLVIVTKHSEHAASFVGLRSAVQELVDHLRQEPGANAERKERDEIAPKGAENCSSGAKNVIFGRRGAWRPLLRSVGIGGLVLVA